MNNIETELVARARGAVKDQVRHHFEQTPLVDLASLDSAEALARELAAAVAQETFAEWASVLEKAAVTAALTCPGCGHPRKVKRRAPMEIRVLGLSVAVAKPYLECARCEAPGVSIGALVTGLVSGTASSELTLRAAYAASQHSYGKASRDIAAHYGETVERTGLRRLALEVEKEAVLFTERERAAALARLGAERRVVGVPTLMLQGDGGTVRTGTLVPCVRGDPGFGKTTPKRKTPRRKRPTQFRELMTFDVREPGAALASALDVMVPIHAQEGERSRRMLALAARKGLGEGTEVIGLGDMGSSLPDAFKDAFFAYDKSRWYTDWHHICDYVHKAGDVLSGVDVPHWRERLRTAVWKRDERERDRLLRRAHKNRVPELPAHMDKCPVAKLETYLRNNWEHMHSAELKARGLDFVSARAEAQVRDRTHGRFCVPGAWRDEKIEGKATLRAIIDEGSWPGFRADFLGRAARTFAARFAARLEKARADGRLSTAQLSNFLGIKPEQRTLRVAA